MRCFHHHSDGYVAVAHRAVRVGGHKDDYENSSVQARNISTVAIESVQVGDVGEVDEHKDVVDDVLSRLYCGSHGRVHVHVAHGRLPGLASTLRLEMLLRHRSCVEY